MSQLRFLRFLSGLTALAIASGAVSLPAQEASLPLQGQRVRLVLQAGEPVVGHLLESHADSFRLAGSRGPARTIPASEVRRLEVSVGRHSRAGHGAIIGSAVGGALGLLAVASSGGDYYYTDGEKAAGVVGLTAMGAGVGALIGGLTHSERWQEVNVMRSSGVSLMVRPATRSVGLRLALGPGGRR
jgi:hypothetical protein